LTYANLVGNPAFQSAWSGLSPESSLPSTTTAELKRKVLDLMREGVSSDIIARYVKSQRLVTPLSAAEILDWKKSGIADEVVKAALPDSRSDTP
jgi:hypothetical protein